MLARILAAALLLSPLAAAAEPTTDAPTYVVTVVIEDDEGEIFARPRMILREGGDASVVVQGRYRIDTTIARSTVDDQPQLTLNAKIYHPDGVDWKLISSPRMVFVPTGTARFVSPVGDWDRLEMTVVAAE